MVRVICALLIALLAHSAYADGIDDLTNFMMTSFTNFFDEPSLHNVITAMDSISCQPETTVQSLIDNLMNVIVDNVNPSLVPEAYTAYSSLQDGINGQGGWDGFAANVASVISQWCTPILQACQAQCANGPGACSAAAMQYANIDFIKQVVDDLRSKIGEDQFSTLKNDLGPCCLEFSNWGY
ncbi:hypothetical protein L596_030563 [Steinernema carpocapsae]|uniref:Saposin B-type domain-containing protein n=1 Tax=Steinernema carpocapsae TaxID=34508 RepID=A0A4U5LPR9_STECR|nr:hypothetical protein L596_030563 [Steinernema carpocapsae]